MEVIIFRQDISASGLYLIVRREYSKIEDPRQSRKTSISYVDALTSAMALFALKSPSLLAFEKDVRQDEVVLGNLKRIFHIGEVPSDTTMREIIDEIPLVQLHKPFTRIFAALQRGKDLEPYLFMDGHYLLALDGTGFFFSPSVNCGSCCVMNHRIRYMNDVELNDASKLRTNFFECIETRKDGSKVTFTWVTDITITDENIFQLMKAGRARWKIENETFNTLKKPRVPIRAQLRTRQAQPEQQYDVDVFD